MNNKDNKTIQQMATILEIAQSQIGVKEDPARTNRGEAIKYQKAAGLGNVGGSPWCQAFVYWCGLEAYGAANPVPKTAGCIDAWNKAGSKVTRNQAIANPSLISPGDQFILDFGEGKGHTGIVTAVNADGTYSTIEGNSNADGSRDGYEVAERKGRNCRKLSDVRLRGFIVYREPLAV